ncbi:hypothetical protein D3C76_980010 [compost metagenome]
MRQRRLGRGLGLADACTRTIGWHGPGQRRAKAPAVGRRFAEVFQDTDGADLGTDADVRIKLTGSYADGRRGRRQAALSLTDVRTPLEQRGAIAHRQHLGDVRQLGAISSAGWQLRHRFGQQHRQGIQARLTCSLVARQLGTQRLELGL